MYNKAITINLTTSTKDSNEYYGKILTDLDLNCTFPRLRTETESIEFLKKNSKAISGALYVEIEDEDSIDWGSYSAHRQLIQAIENGTFYNRHKHQLYVVIRVLRLHMRDLPLYINHYDPIVNKIVRWRLENKK